MGEEGGVTLISLDIQLILTSPPAQFSHSLTHSLTHSHIHPPTTSLTHSLHHSRLSSLHPAPRLAHLRPDSRTQRPGPRSHKCRLPRDLSSTTLFQSVSVRNGRHCSFFPMFFLCFPVFFSSFFHVFFSRFLFLESQQHSRVCLCACVLCCCDTVHVVINCPNRVVVGVTIAAVVSNCE